MREYNLVEIDKISRIYKITNKSKVNEILFKFSSVKDKNADVLIETMGQLQLQLCLIFDTILCLYYKI